MRWIIPGIFILTAPLMAGDVSASAAHDLARPLCASLVRAVSEAAPEGGPAFVASYRQAPDEAEVPEALRNSAFTYDNALAIVALLACGDTAAARRIADAFLVALDNDRSFHDGRIRNAYRAGPVKDRPILLAGWWDRRAGHWAEDRYQNGSATGNVAWAAMALLTAYEETRDPRYLNGAREAADWIATVATDTHAVGYKGGREGFDTEQVPLEWKSTEHNTDILALANRLAAHGDEKGRYAAMARSARAFLDLAFDRNSGCFRMGTTPEGAMRGVEAVALDTQLWPLIALSATPPEWKSALTCAERRLGVAGGFDFNDDRDGLWTEGTAQAALIYRVLGRQSEAGALLDTISAESSPSGWLYATREARLSTGLMIGPWSTENDFFYFRRPHLGATAWAVLAATGRNPFLPSQSRR